MLSKSVGFARYSKGLCWIVSGIWLALSILTFTGGSENSVINSLLWLTGAVAFAVSALFLGKDGSSNTAPARNSEPQA
ncbi:MAG: hypothetical protein ACI95C_000786 [Pseudohongiellaceae bacterium]|jgi:hypothetical protein